MTAQNIQDDLSAPDTLELRAKLFRGLSDPSRLTILDESLSLPIGAWLYRSGSRLNQAAERFWQHIKTRNEPRE